MYRPSEQSNISGMSPDGGPVDALDELCLALENEKSRDKVVKKTSAMSNKDNMATGTSGKNYIGSGHVPR